ncbi:PQQ-dependent sugar dehydrogenase [Rhodocaloribacter litoris]|uniref:PQQ-dependent sugar dehydrogenase n=1 Tax=Rhodocaloribacter litoris TaxID=2558931 RepID=UPI0014210BEB|nr:PQQ-dependent sugar dehydrogenase [Rhodocaloribacter litoris]QXD17100.1 PQQ-dependent sugar dehydrogenase [Rhodocaloribacter litoris]
MRNASRLFSLPVCCLMAATACGQAPPEESVEQGGDLELEVAFPNLTFSRPVDLQHAGDGSGRLFVVEQAGVIRVFENRTGVASAATFLDIRDRVNDSGNEEGLLGLAFHPDFATNGFFFVNYTATNPRRTVIARFSVDPDDPDRADPASETVILEVEQPFSNHNAGQLAFGPDGYLYVGLGDGGSAGDPLGHGQNPATLLGALLRLDVDHPDPERNYGIPDDNPFVGQAGFREELYAYGFRNPWRFSFDPATGRLWLADVGQNAWEEVDLVEKGGNYGWNVMEGTHCFNPPSGCDDTGLIPPVWEYDHSLGASITGGYVYRGAAVPELAGKYVYADFISGRVWALTYDGTRATSEQLLDTSLGIASFGLDEQGELYLCAFDGRIYRFVPVMSSAREALPGQTLHLGAGYPNPFRGETTIPFTLDRPGRVQLAVYDLLGRVVRTLVSSRPGPGPHAVLWDGHDETGRPLPGGVYLYRLVVDGTPVATRRLVLVR